MSVCFNGNMRAKKYLQILILLTSLTCLLIFTQTSSAANKTKAKTSTTQKATTQKITKPKVTKSTKKSVPNGTLSSNLEISEVFPNPKGPDTGKEWLELHNSGSKTINLGNWLIRQKNPQKPSVKVKVSKLSNNLEIKSNGYLTLSKIELKNTLNNSNNLIELVDFQGKVMDKASYKESKEDLSLSKINIKNWENNKLLQKTWISTKPSKNLENPTYYKLDAKVIEADFEENLKNNILNLTTGKNQKIEVKISKNNQTSLLKPNLKITAIVEKINNNYLLYNYKILPQAKNPDSNTNPIDNWLSTLFKIILCLILGLIVVLMVRKIVFKKYQMRGIKKF